MIWFNIQELEGRLINDELTDKESFDYLLSSSILFTFFTYIGTKEHTNDWLHFLELIISLVITIVGTKATYEVNARGGQKDYLKRYFSISFVIGIQLCLYVFLFALLIGIIVATMHINLINEEIIKLIFVLVFGIVYYLMVTNSFKRVNKTN